MLGRYLIPPFLLFFHIIWHFQLPDYPLVPISQTIGTLLYLAMLQTGVRTRQFNPSWTRIIRETSWLKPSGMSHCLRMTWRIHLWFSGQNTRNWHCTASLKHTILLSMFFTVTSYSHKWRCTDTPTAIA